MRRKSSKKSRKSVKRKAKLPLVVDPATRKPSVFATLIFALTVASALGIASYVAYEIIINGHCWSWF